MGKSICFVNEKISFCKLKELMDQSYAFIVFLNDFGSYSVVDVMGNKTWRTKNIEDYAPQLEKESILYECRH